jgi:hypothetical protein
VGKKLLTLQFYVDTVSLSKKLKYKILAAEVKLVNARIDSLFKLQSTLFLEAEKSTS